MSNIRLLFVGLMLLKQSARQSDKAIRCGQKLKSAVVIKKPKKVTEGIYNWILQNNHVVQYPIVNNFLYVSIDGKPKEN